MSSTDLNTNISGGCTGGVEGLLSMLVCAFVSTPLGQLFQNKVSSAWIRILLGVIITVVVGYKLYKAVRSNKQQRQQQERSNNRSQATMESIKQKERAIAHLWKSIAKQQEELADLKREVAALKRKTSRDIQNTLTGVFLCTLLELEVCNKVVTHLIGAVQHKKGMDRVHH